MRVETDYAPALGGGQRLGQAKLGDVGGEEGVRLAGDWNWFEAADVSFHLFKPHLRFDRAKGLPIGMAYLGAAPSFLLAGQSWCGLETEVNPGPG